MKEDKYTDHLKNWYYLEVNFATWKSIRPPFYQDYNAARRAKRRKLKVFPESKISIRKNLLTIKY